MLVPSENIPVAVSCNVKPRGMDGLFGVTDIENKVAGVTVSVVFPAVLPRVTVIEVVPGSKRLPSRCRSRSQQRHLRRSK